MTVSADGTGHLLAAGQHADVGVADRQPVEDVMARARHVEEHVVAGAVEDHLAIAGGHDRDRPIGGAVERQAERPVERRHLRIDVVQPLRPVQSGVHDDGVAGLRRPLVHDAPVAEPGAVVGVQQAGEAGLLFRPLVIGRIDVERAAAREPLRLDARPGAHGHGPLPVDAVGIGEDEAALVLRSGLEPEDAAGEAVRHGVVEMLAPPVDLFPADPHQRQRGAPGVVANGAERHVDRCVAVGVAVDGPLEAEAVERGVLDDEPAGRCPIRWSLRGQREQRLGDVRLEVPRARRVVLPAGALVERARLRRRRAGEREPDCRDGDEEAWRHGSGAPGSLAWWGP